MFFSIYFYNKKNSLPIQTLYFICTCKKETNKIGHCKKNKKLSDE